MSGIRRITALLICTCLFLVALSPAALAADERKTRPTVKVTRSDTIRPGAEGLIVLNCGKPGFLTARVLDSEGNEVASLCENLEVSSGENTLVWDGMLLSGSPAEKGGKYRVGLMMRDEWGNELKSEVTASLKIGDLRPELTDVAFQYDSRNKQWVISGTTSMAGRLVIDLHTAADLENTYTNIVTGYERNSKEAQLDAGESFTHTWNGQIEEIDGKDTYSYPLDPGYYAICVFLDDKDDVRSEEVVIYVSVDSDKDRTPYLTGEEPAGFTVKANSAGTSSNNGASNSANDKDVADGEEADDEDADEVGSAQTTSAETARIAGPQESIKGADGLTLGVVMGEEGLQIGAGVSDTAEQAEPNYWSLSADATDEEIWAALIRPIVSIDEDERNSVSVLATPESSGEKIAQVNGLTQALNVVGETGDWSIVEVFRNEDSAFTRGYIRTSRLRTVEPDQEYGVTIDKATQTLTVWHNGERVGSVAICTGLANEEHPERETPAGEFILATRMGTREMNMGFCEYTIRLSGDIWIHEIPSTRRKGSDFSELEDVLGEKMTRGTIAVAHESSEDGAINMEWIWQNLNRKRVKVLIFDDKDRDVVPYMDASKY